MRDGLVMSRLPLLKCILRVGAVELTVSGCAVLAIDLQTLFSVFYSALGRGAEYHATVSVHVSETARPTFIFTVHVAYDLLDPPLAALQYVMYFQFCR